jgi:hypothetical protein
MNRPTSDRGTSTGNTLELPPVRRNYLEASARGQKVEQLWNTGRSLYLN